MDRLRECFASITTWRVMLTLAILAGYLCAFAAGEYWMRGVAVAEITEGNRRIEDLNIRLKAALEGDTPPEVCAAPPASQT